MLVSVTRLRLRGLRFLPLFAVHTLRSRRQVQTSPGFAAGMFAVQPLLAFWTVTVWDDEAIMRAFRNGGDHAQSMRHLLDWCDEASYVHWSQDTADLPTAAESFERLRDTGKPSKVRRPSAAHAAGRLAGKRQPRLANRIEPKPT